LVMVSVAHCAIILAIASNSALISADRTAANPIRRVVSMLQMMSKKIAATGEIEEKQYDKFMCYCKNGGSTLAQSIADANTKIPQLESSITESGSKVMQMKADVKQGKIDRDDAKNDVKSAIALREKEAAAFASYSAEARTNIKAMAGAIAALEKGMGGAFLQTPAAALLQHVAASSDLDDSDRQMLTAFLSQGYAPQSGQITGILKELQDTWTADLAKATEEEETSKANYDGLVKAKTKEIDVLQKMIETKTQRIGEEGVEIVNMADDLEDTKNGLAEDTKFLADLDTNCETKKAEWVVRQKLRAEEQLALADTIKVLNDDDALELFKQTLPSPAMLQLVASSKKLQRRVLELLKNPRKDARIDLIALALRGGKVNFEKVLKMIDDMVSLLGEEQQNDNDKKVYCDKEFDSSEDEQKGLDHAISDLETLIDSTNAAISTITEEISTLEQGVRDVDKRVTEATIARKEAHATYVEELSANKGANELLSIAKNRLNKFYNPKLYKAPPKRELSEEQRISSNLGGTLAPTAPPGGIAGTGVTALAQRERPAPAPEIYGAYKKSNQESTGVIAMIDLLKADLEKEISESEVEEKHDQAEYEQMVSDSAGKRAQDSKSIAHKQGARADAEADLVAAKSDHKEKTKSAMANAEYIHSLHQECDWLISNFDVRKEARASEVESLKNAKAVLSGADYSLLEVNTLNRLRR